MTVPLSAGAAAVLQHLHRNGFEAYVVGGCVRDALLGCPIHDYDICTNALPQQMQQCFEGMRVIPTGIAHGTLTVLYGDEAVEVTTYRLDGAYTDHRHPERVSFVSSLQQDLQRRDFTVNAMAWHPQNGLVDPFGGREDLQNGVLRCVGDPEQRFREDALRILRGLRFAARYRLTPHPDTADAMHRLAPLLQRISAERILQELRGLLAAEHPEEMLLQFSDVIAAVLPEVAPCIGFEQNSRYHCYDVYTHCVKAACAVANEPTVRLTLLLHDCAKPLCYTEENGVGHFYGHAVRGEALARSILTRLHAERSCIEQVATLIHWHDVPITRTPAAMRRLLSKLGEQTVRRLLLVKTGDALAHHPDLHDSRLQQLQQLSDLLETVLAQKPCLTVRDLAVDGTDLQSIGIAPGPDMGKALHRLLDAVLDDSLPNQRQALLDALKQA